MKTFFALSLALVLAPVAAQADLLEPNVSSHVGSVNPRLGSSGTRLDNVDSRIGSAGPAAHYQPARAYQPAVAYQPARAYQPAQAYQPARPCQPARPGGC